VDLKQRLEKLLGPTEDLAEHEKAAEAYFTQSVLSGTKVPRTPPVRGSKDSQKITYLLGLLQRAGSLPLNKTEAIST
jgi:hypothetical protein